MRLRSLLVVAPCLGFTLCVVLMFHLRDNLTTSDQHYKRLRYKVDLQENKANDDINSSFTKHLNIDDTNHQQEVTGYKVR